MRKKNNKKQNKNTSLHIPKINNERKGSECTNVPALEPEISVDFKKL